MDSIDVLIRKKKCSPTLKVIFCIVGILKTELNVFQLNFVVSVSDNMLHSGMNLILL